MSEMRLKAHLAIAEEQAGSLAVAHQTATMEASRLARDIGPTLEPAEAERLLQLAGDFQDTAAAAHEAGMAYVAALRLVMGGGKLVPPPAPPPPPAEDEPPPLAARRRQHA